MKWEEFSKIVEAKLEEMGAMDKEMSYIDFDIECYERNRKTESIVIGKDYHGKVYII